jgi:hypothetical protein
VKELQSVALGLAVVFLDYGDPDWVADPIGWLLVLVGIAAVKERLTDYGYLQVTAWVCLVLSVVTWPPDSVPTLDETLGWVFSLPTLAFCFLLADSLTDVTQESLSQRFRTIAWVYALVTVLPLLALLGWEWLETPARVLTIVIHVVMVLSLFSAADEDSVLPAPAQGGEATTTTDTADSGSGTRSGKQAPAEAADKTKDRAKAAPGAAAGNVRRVAKDTAGSATGKTRSGDADTGATKQSAQAADEGRHKA